MHHIFSILVILIFSVKAFAADRTVCTITINSPDEKNLFQSSLKNKGFKFVELTEFGEGGENDGESWFDAACEAGVECDVLVVSGHFGGNFFGSSGKELPLSMLEKHSCAQTCDGITSRPKEVFLFGCNTLAGKEKDHRTREQYIQVLVADQIPRDEAEMIAEARYGAMGNSFKERMQRVFSGVPRIYGFDSVGPSGTTVRPFLQSYFSKIPDYGKHLLQYEGQEVLQSLAKINNAIGVKMDNRMWAEAMKGTAEAQCAGLSPKDPAYRHKEILCRLYDESLSLKDRLNVVKSMLLSADRLIYIPTILAFLEENSWQIDQDPELKKALRQMFAGKEAQEAFRMAVQSATTPLLKVEVLSAQKTIGLITEGQFTARVKEIIKPMLQNVTRANLDTLCSLPVGGYDDGPKLNVRYEDFTVTPRNGLYVGAAANCLGTTDTRFTRLVLNSVSNAANKEERQGVVWELTEMPGFDAERKAFFQQNLKSSDEVVRQGAARGLFRMASGTELASVIPAYLANGGNSWELAETLREKRLVNESAAQAIWRKQQEGGEDYSTSLALTIPDESPLWTTLKTAKDFPADQFIEGLAERQSEVTMHKANDYVISKIEGDAAAAQAATQYFSNHPMTPADRTRVFGILARTREPAEATYLRGLLRKQTHLPWSSADIQKVTGDARVYSCRRSGSMTTCAFSDVPLPAAK